jgi:hypothetical protein
MKNSLAAKNNLAALAAAAAIVLAAAAIANTADAQWRDPHGGAAAGGIIGGLAAGAAMGANMIAPPSYGAYGYQPFYPACQVRREQFADEYGWRVRDVRVCP